MVRYQHCIDVVQFSTVEIYVFVCPSICSLICQFLTPLRTDLLTSSGYTHIWVESKMKEVNLSRKVIFNIF